MELQNIKITFCLTGSHCTLDDILPELEKIIQEGAEVQPVISESVDTTDTRFGEAVEWKHKLVKMTGRKLANSIVSAEPIGPRELADVLVIAPCTGNTLAKLANGITDTPVTMAAKAQLRNQKPVIIALSTNDALGLNGKNLGIMFNAKNVFFVPFSQDEPFRKPNSVVSNMKLIIPTILHALEGKQLQPVLLSPEEE